MKRILTVLCVVIITGMLVACAGSSAKKEAVSSDIKAEPATISNDKPDTALKLTEQSRKPAPDNSEIVVSSDELGNRVETRTFADNSRVAAVTVHHNADGTKEVFVHPKNGEKIKVSNHLATAALSSRASDFANLANIPVPPETKQPAITANPYPVSATPNPEYEMQADTVSAPSAEEIQRQREAAQKAEAERLKQLQKQVSGLPPAQRRKQESGTQPED